MSTFIVDGVTYPAGKNQNLLEACLSVGLNLPYFCWHPALGSVGACRQCAVILKGKLIMACMTPVAPGIEISIENPLAQAFRKGVIEWLMVNHPHDCPVCDEGGECHLQDMTLMTGHSFRRYRFRKRTFRNQDLGPFVYHEMNRCITCYRCVRFYRDYARGKDLNAFAAHDHVYFGRREDGVLESEFSGNLVEVCPTGVFTDKTLQKHYVRKWDLQTAPSICAHCAVGCNTLSGSRKGQMRQVRNRFHPDINAYFICDRGRYGYEYVNSEYRIFEPSMRTNEPSPGVASVRRSGRVVLDLNEKTQTLTLDESMRLLVSIVKNDKTIGIGSPRASVESNFALRALVGENRFISGMSYQEFNLVSLALTIFGSESFQPPTVRELEQSDAILVLAEDISNTAPRLALAFRRASTQGGSGFILASHSTRLDELASFTHFGAPADLARMGFAIANGLDPTAPEVKDLNPEEARVVRQIVSAFKGARRPVILTGLGPRESAVVMAASNIALALKQVRGGVNLGIIPPECNSFGVGLMSQFDIGRALQLLRNRDVETVIILENDLFRRDEQEQIDALLSSAKQVILMDSLASGVASKAHLILPVTTFAESEGTFVNYEMRMQRYFSAISPVEKVTRFSNLQDSWRWIQSVRYAIEGETENPGDSNTSYSIDDLHREISMSLPLMRKIAEIAPPGSFRIKGSRIPRQPHRFSGRTAMYAGISVHETPPPPDPDSPFSFSMEGSTADIPFSMLPRYWAPGWNSTQALNRFGIEKDEFPKSVVEFSKTEKTIGYFRAIPPAFQPISGFWWAIPIYTIFGSDELSALSAGIAERMPEPFVVLHPVELADLSLNEGGKLNLHLRGGSVELSILADSKMPKGIVGLSEGLPIRKIPYLRLPAWFEISKGAGMREQAPEMGAA